MMRRELTSLQNVVLAGLKTCRSKYQALAGKLTYTEIGSYCLRHSFKDNHTKVLNILVIIQIDFQLGSQEARP